MKEVIINSEPVELYKILKFEGLVSNGGEAKAVVEEGQVRLNGQVETQKRKKVMAGDIIEYAGEKFTMVLGVAGKEAAGDDSAKPRQKAGKPAGKSPGKGKPSSAVVQHGGVKIRKRKTDQKQSSSS